MPKGLPAKRKGSMCSTKRLSRQQFFRDRRNTQKYTSCPKHNKPNNVYCEKCDELICFKCSHDETHRDHPSDPC